MSSAASHVVAEVGEHRAEPLHGRADLRVEPRAERPRYGGRSDDRDPQPPGPARARGGRRRTARPARAGGGGRRRGCRPPRRAAAPRRRPSAPAARCTVRPLNASGSGQVEIRPRCGLIPTRCVHAAGIRTEPSPSEPSAPGHEPGGDGGRGAAGGAAGRVLEAPRVARDAERGALGDRPLPELGRASSCRRSPHRPRAAAGRPRQSADAGSNSPAQPNAVVSPARSTSSLIATGTPSSGTLLAGGAPPVGLRRPRPSAASARTQRNALSVGCAASIRPQRQLHQLTRGRPRRARAARPGRRGRRSAELRRSQRAEHLGGGALAGAHGAVHVAVPVRRGLGSGPVDPPHRPFGSELPYATSVPGPRIPTGQPRVHCSPTSWSRGTPSAWRPALRRSSRTGRARRRGAAAGDIAL